MLLALPLLPLSLLAPSAWAQLPLPNPPYTPPDLTHGTNVTNATSPNSQWSILLGNLLYFYDEQRSGKLPSNRVPWRNDSALDDGKDVGHDLSGGWYDAGDYVKYTFPMSFSLMSICWGALDAGRGYELANQSAYLDDTVRWGLDWLIKAHPSPSLLYVQVGNGNLDNAYWGGDKYIPTDPRPSYSINSTKPGTDAAAQASAAFAACSALYDNRTLSATSATSALTDSNYASQLLQHARDLYQFATTATMQVYNDSVPEATEAYPSSGYYDELAIAALFLALADSSSNATGYYADAVTWYYSQGLDAQLQAGSESGFDWDDKMPGIVVLGAQLASAYPDVIAGSNATLTVWTNASEKYFDIFVSGDKGARTHLTTGGLLWFPGDSDSNSLPPALGLAMLMMRYALSGLTEKKDTYTAYAQRQLDYAMGNNPMHVPYVVGIHPNSPKNPHSAIATGYNPTNSSLDRSDPSVSNASFAAPDVVELDAVPEQEAYILYGGVVGGPNEDDKFWDLRADWARNEVALDYNAPLLTLVAQALVRGVHDPFYTSVKAGAYDEVRPRGAPCDDFFTLGCKTGRLTKAQLIATVFFSVLGSLLILGLIAWWWLRRRRPKTL